MIGDWVIELVEIAEPSNHQLPNHLITKGDFHAHP